MQEFAAFPGYSSGHYCFGDDLQDIFIRECCVFASSYKLSHVDYVPVSLMPAP